MKDRIRISWTDWLRIGAELFGADRRDWKFECVQCGNVQSHTSVVQRNPKIESADGWIYFSCEGRHTPGVGCDWTLGGLFTIHTLEVMVDGAHHPVFRYAHERADDLLLASRLP